MKLATLVCCAFFASCLTGCGAPDPRVARQVAIIPPPADLPAPPPETPAASAPARGEAPAPAEASPVEPPAPTVQAEAAAPPPAPPPAPTPVAMPQPPRRADVLYFKSDAYKVDGRYRALLESHARRLKAEPRLHLIIEAHADSRGDREYNLALSKKRAETVAKHLRQLGVPARQLEIVYRGEPGGERVAAAERRVELLYQTR
ncbi:OmpA family protein [Piscinibacter sp. XHJ-5]|uniref:OmpA family protein n=1 Tax=Piscinibacter sp. XHJ-5 TaxID=3037797 RepID=UPI00245286BF|nr:OmpA family protein [Piscinibacter sp. XHJ-5]